MFRPLLLPCLLSSLSLAAALPLAHSKDGRSHLTPDYPRWLGDGDAPWDCFIGASNDGLDAIPVTGAVRSYEWTIARATLAPDGVTREMIVVNDQFPGPVLEANWGDIIEITVFNNITGPEEPTALHWHGMLQTGTPWADGTLGVSQCPIAPGSFYTYRFRADVYGTSFWHSHYSAQYTAGVAGAVQIYGPSERSYDIDLGPAMFSDWYHLPYTAVTQNFQAPNLDGPPPTSDSGLINGRGRYDCSLVQEYPATGEKPDCNPNAEYTTFRFQSGKKHRLRLINHGAAGIQKISIDDHTFTVIAEDFVPVKPYETKIVSLGVGQRTDVIVHAHKDPKSSAWMRSQLPGGVLCGGNDNMQANKAMVYYEDADTTIAPASISENNDAACVNDPLPVSEPETAIPISPDFLQLDFTLGVDVNDEFRFVWVMNNESWSPDLSNPLLFRDDLSSVTETSLYNVGNAKSIRLNVTNTTPLPHPMHLHGYDFQVIASGPDIATSIFPQTDVNPVFAPPPVPWDGSIEVSTNNPPRRDVHLVPALGYSVFQFNTYNPGVWPFHCHTAWHLSGGMSVNLVVRPDDIAVAPAGTKERTCNAWMTWAEATSYHQTE